MLACAASRAFALSLLGRRPACGSDGATPSSSVVLVACGHLPLGSEACGGFVTHFRRIVSHPSASLHHHVCEKNSPSSVSH